MRNYRELSQEEVQQLERLYPVTPNRVLARQFDISVDGLMDYVARPRGWQKDRKAVLIGNRHGRSLTERETQWFIRHYQHTRNQDIMEKFGIGESTLHRVARKYGLKKSKPFMRKVQQNATEAAHKACTDYGIYEETSRKQRQRMADLKARGERMPGSFMPGQSNKDRLSPKRYKECLAKTQQKRNKTIRSDRIRIHFGLEPRTKLVKHWNVHRDWHKPHYRYKFRQFGYSVEPDSHEVYYFPDTVRHPIMEHNAQKYGFKILPAEDNILY